MKCHLKKLDQKMTSKHIQYVFQPKLSAYLNPLGRPSRLTLMRYVHPFACKAMPVIDPTTESFNLMH
jgi:hypothetical protein